MVENTIKNTTLAYYQILLQKANLELAQEIQSLSEDRYKREQDEIEFGTTVTYDLLQAKTAYLEDRASLLSAEANLNNAVRQLNFIMSAPLEQVYVFTSEFKAETDLYDQQVLLQKMQANNNNLKLVSYHNQELSVKRFMVEISQIFSTISTQKYCIEYPFSYFDGKITLKQAVEKIKTNTRRYAKRHFR